MRPAVFLDRDGVINRSTVRDGTPYPPYVLDEVEILPGVSDAMGRLRAAGLLLIVVTNQPDVARGKQSAALVEQINDLLRNQLPIDAVYCCYHDNADQCDCRKPKPGLLQQAANEYRIDLVKSFMVGDRWSDIAAGAAVGCTTFLIDLPYSGCERCAPDYKVADLSEAAAIILRLKQTSAAWQETV